MVEDISKFSFLKPIKDNWKVLLEDYHRINDKLMPWHEVDIYNKGWDIFGLIHKDYHIKENQMLVPNTTEIIKQIPFLYMAGFSILKGETKIYPHNGYTGEVFRCHTGLSCPEDCFIQIGEHKQYWKDGEQFVFDDTQLHSAENNSNKDRVVFIVDFYKDKYEAP